MKELEAVAKEARRLMVEMHYRAKDAHLGCAMSMVEIMVSLYFRVMKADPSNPNAPDRDRFILSKAWAPSALYAVMCERGFFDRETLATFAQNGTRIASIGTSGVLPGVEASGGSAGQGLSVGIGMALVSRADKTGSRIFVLMGDGEVQEGSTWEAAMFAASRRLSSLTLIVDRNMFQTWSKVDDVVGIEPLAERFRAFGWDADEVDGHDIEKLTEVLGRMSSRPHAVIARTTKGKGISFMEGSGDWHNGVLTEEQYKIAARELNHA